MKRTLTAGEQKVLESYERDEWRPITKSRQTVRQLQAYARATLRKDKRISIRLPSEDIQKIQTIAVDEGLPYQTLIASVIHKYAAGHFLDRKLPRFGGGISEERSEYRASRRK